MKAYGLGKSEERNPLAVTDALAPVNLSGRAVKLGRGRTGLPWGSWTRMREGGKGLSGSQQRVTQGWGAAKGRRGRCWKQTHPLYSFAYSQSCI